MAEKLSLKSLIVHDIVIPVGFVLFIEDLIVVNEARLKRTKKGELMNDLTVFEENGRLFMDRGYCEHLNKPNFRLVDFFIKF